MIRDYGLEPDLEKPNPHYRGGAPMKLYDINRIAQIESGSWFHERYVASLPRRERAKRAVRTKYEKKRDLSAEKTLTRVSVNKSLGGGA